MNPERKTSTDVGLGLGDAFLDEMSSIVFEQGYDGSSAPALLDDLNPIPIPVRVSDTDLQHHIHRRHSDSAVYCPSTSPTPVSASSSVNGPPINMAPPAKQKGGVKSTASKVSECANLVLRTH